MFVKMDGQQFVEAFRVFFFCLFFSCKVGKIAMTGLAFTQLFLLELTIIFKKKTSVNYIATAFPAHMI